MSEVLNEHHYGKITAPTKRGWIIFAVGILVSILVYNILPYDQTARKGIAMLTLVAILWFTEAFHITITALLVPIIGVIIGMQVKDAKMGEMVAISTKQALSTFSDPIIFLFFGGFALATALHIQKIDKKIATWIISLSGSHLGLATLMICLVTAFLSMWISNTATAAMMLPLAIGLFSQLDPEKDRKTLVFLLLGIAYSASIGGLGTVVGSPPNGIAARELNLTFGGWMKYGLPMMLVILPLMLVVLYLVLKPDLNRKIKLELEPIPWTKTRIMTMVLFACTAIAWMASTWLGKTFGIKSPDTWIALVASALVVILGLATWKEVSINTEWGVLLLFGGGLSLSAMLKDSGAFVALGKDLAEVFGSSPKLVIVFIISVFIILLTEFTSNTASAALLVPVFGGIAPELGLSREALVLVIGIGASCAFMLPVATPPNAVVFGTGLIKQKEMMMAGAFLSGGCVILLTILSWFIM